MRRLLLGAVLGASLLAAAAPAGAVSVGVGAYGGMAWPIVQDNMTQGFNYGVVVPVNVAPMVTIEPWYQGGAMGDVEETFAGASYTRTGPDVASFGVSALLRFGTSFAFYPFGGIGRYTIEQDGTEDVEQTGYRLGLGMDFPVMPKLRVFVRGSADVVKTGDTSRKFGNAHAGLSYDLFDFGGVQ